MKKKRKINETKLLQQLASDDMMNWLVIEGVKRFREEKELGPNITYFLERLGILIEE